MVRRQTKKWISATISKEMDSVVRQKALELYNGNYSKALEHIIAVYRSVWTDLMMARLKHDLLLVKKEQEKKLKEQNLSNR